MRRWKALAVLPAAVLLALVAIRAMTFVAPLDHPLAALRTSFPGHPDALTEKGMSQIGAAAAKGAPMPVSARQAIAAAARKAPLAPEPYLVEGTASQMKGAGDQAETLFLAARLRDPRAPAARYFLADHYLRTGKVGAGLVEMAVLARLSERASQPFGPALAEYAKTPGAVPELRRFFRTAPQLRDLTLSILAGDPANTPLVLSLVEATSERRDPPPDWQGRLVGSLIQAGDYAAANRVWRRITGITDPGLLYNPQFRDKSAPPPFNWQLYSGSAGVAEASGAGGLDVIYYGREDTVLATQILRLPPGRYRLAMRIEGASTAAGVAWTVTCIGAKEPIFRLSLDRTEKGMVAGALAVPAANCSAQSLDLRGRPGETSGTAQLTISELSLLPIAAAS
jgi:hypothetical protein